MNRYIKMFLCLLLTSALCLSCGKDKNKIEPPETFVGNSSTSETGFGNTETNGAGSNVTGSGEYDIRINEVLYENSVYRFSGKEAYTFIELYNFGKETVELGGFKLTTGSGEITLTGSMAPGEYLMVFPGADVPTQLGQSALSLRLFPKCTLSLFDKQHKLIQSVTLPELKKDSSYAYRAPMLGEYTESEYVVTSFVTPGYENTESGLVAWYESNDLTSGLVINEVMNANRKYLETLDAYYDWIELRNVTDQTIELKNYYLSDKESNLQKWQLPEKILAPGETFLVFAESDDAEILNGRGYVCCGFSLSADREQVYLTDADGRILDAMLVTGTTQNGSYGRMEGEAGFFYFETPTPQAINSDGCRLIATTPVFSNAGGVFNDSNGIQVSIKGEGIIYYTLDGSVPTVNSAKYNGGSISMGETGVLRAVSIVDGKITGRAATASFVINENHTLPILSIAIDPEDMYGDKTGIYVVGEGNDPDAWAGEANYTKGWEKTVHVSYFEKDGTGFMIDCGIKIAGSGTKAYPKKSFQLKFRGIYGASELEYDIFGTGVETFQNIKLRCGEDYVRTTFRDELQAALVSKNMNSLLAQRYRWIVLYIDGEYFGLYAFRDMTDENYVAKTENTDVANVTKLECDGNTKLNMNKDFVDLVNFCYTKDLSNYENYRYVTQRLDIESITQWFIARLYSGDDDYGNCRYYRIGDDGKWKWIFYDCDWGFHYVYLTKTPYQALTREYFLAFPTVKIMRGLVKNPEYRDYFLTELGKHLRTTYAAENVLSEIESFDALLRSEIPRDRERWGEATYELYLTKLDEMKAFAKERPAYVIQFTKEYFDLSDAQVQQYFGGIL